MPRFPLNARPRSGNPNLTVCHEVVHSFTTVDSSVKPTEKKTPRVAPADVIDDQLSLVPTEPQVGVDGGFYPEPDRPAKTPRRPRQQ